jgi:uncharacterized protein (DUF2235 family)
VKNIVLCFDRARDYPLLRCPTNAVNLLRLVDESSDQRTWYHSGTSVPAATGGRLGTLRWREAAIDDAHTAVTGAYEFLLDRWRPDDRIFLFGVGRGAYCAHALTRLLGTIGVLPELMDYVLATYAVPRTHRTEQDWLRVRELASQLSGKSENAIPVQFLGLWDMVGVPGLPRKPEILTNVAVGRHAVAVDGGLAPFGGQLVSPDSERIEEVWFRGGHHDVAGGQRAHRPLADIAFDWMLDGAREAGLLVRPSYRYTAPAPNSFGALAESSRMIAIRRLPESALVHSSVDMYLRAHPEYWRRLPAHVVWADVDWLARSERLVHSSARTVPVAAGVELTGAATS